MDGPVSKRPRLAADLLGATFNHVEVDLMDTAKMTELIASFASKFPELTRATVSDVGKEVTVDDRFIVLQVTSSRGQCSFNQQKRWRLLTREILPDGVRSDLHFLTITDYVKSVGSCMPEEFKVKTEYQDGGTSAPLLILSGFVKQHERFMNPNWKSDLLCSVESQPRILLATIRAPLFVSDFVEANGTANNPLLPFATSIAKPVYRSPPMSCGYVPLCKLVAGRLHHVVAVVKYHCPPVPSNNGRAWLSKFSLVDPSLDVSKGERLFCQVFANDKTRVPSESCLWNIIIVENLQLTYFREEKQGKGYADSFRFAVVPMEGLLGNALMPGVTTNWSRNQVPGFLVSYVEYIREWYTMYAKEAIAVAETQKEQEVVNQRAVNIQFVGSNPATVACPQEAPVMSNGMVTGSSAHGAVGTGSAELKESAPVARNYRLGKGLSVAGENQALTIVGDSGGSGGCIKPLPTVRAPGTDDFCRLS